MAQPVLTWCPACRGPVSTAAPACPHCGQPLYRPMPKKDPFLDPLANLRSLVGCLVLGVVLFVGAIVCWWVMRQMG